MPGKIKQGQSIFIPFRNGMSIYDSQNKARMYMSKKKFKASFPAFRLGTEDIELLEYVPVRKGRWELMAEADYKCSVCGFRFTSGDPIEMFPYCRCGCKMEG